MPLIARQRPRLAVLAVLALVGSLLAISAVPAVAAKDEKASAVAEFSACVAAATEDAGFTDMDGNFAQDEANCLAHYGITTGTSEGVFSPNDTISRRQMALFLARATGPAGIELDDAEDQGFSDIAGESDAIQNAINQVAGADIMEGSASLFNPDGGVSRADMAVFLDEFLAAAEIELDKNADAPYDVDEDDIDKPFSDVGSVPFATYGAINRLYELGVANGTGDGSTFSPNALLSRAQMAVFITRALAHTNARPAGRSVQVAPADVYDDDGVTVQASVRDSDHQPVADALVEVFTAQTAVDAFDDDGACVDDLKDEDLGSIGAIRCEIDAADEATEPDGNALIDIDADLFCSGDTTVWLWTGDIGDEFNADETDNVSTVLTVSPAPADVSVASDMASDAIYLKFGDTANFELQVVDAGGDDVAIEGLVLKVRTTWSEDGGTSQVSLDDAVTDAGGRAEVSFTFEDNDPGDDADDLGNTAEVTVLVDDVREADGENYDRINPVRVDGAITESVGMAMVVWSDGEPYANKLTINQSVGYHEASEEGSGVRHTVRAALVDQYGDAVSRATIRFWSTADNTPAVGDADETTWDNGLGGLNRADGADDDDEPDLNQVPGTEDNYADERSTNRRGVATKSYSRDAEEDFVEVIYAGFNSNPYDADADVDTVDPEGNEDFEDDEGDDDMGVRDLLISAVHYWAVEADDNDMITGQRLVVANTDANVVVVTDYTVDTTDDSFIRFIDDGNVWIATYDSNDQFNVGAGDTGDTPLTRVTMSFFEKSIADDDGAIGETDLDIGLSQELVDGVSRFTNTGAGPPTGPARCV